MADKAFTIVRNQRTTLYDVHAAGCKHLMAGHLDQGFTVQAPSGAAAGQAFQDRNDDCYTNLAPCAKGKG